MQKISTLIRCQTGSSWTLLILDLVSSINQARGSREKECCLPPLQVDPSLDDKAPMAGTHKHTGSDGLEIPSSPGYAVKYIGGLDFWPNIRFSEVLHLGSL